MHAIEALFSAPLTQCSLSSLDNTLTNGHNELSEVKFQVPENSVRAEHIEKDGILYPVNWNVNKDSIDRRFQGIEINFIKKENYFGAQKRLYYILREIFDSKNTGFVNGHHLVKIFLKLSRVFQLQKDWEKALDTACLASNLDPYNIEASLTAAEMLEKHEQFFDEFRVLEDAAFNHPSVPTIIKYAAQSARRNGLESIALDHEKALALAS